MNNPGKAMRVVSHFLRFTLCAVALCVAARAANTSAKPPGGSNGGSNVSNADGVPPSVVVSSWYMGSNSSSPGLPNLTGVWSDRTITTQTQSSSNIDVEILYTGVATSPTDNSIRLVEKLKFGSLPEIVLDQVFQGVHVNGTSTTRHFFHWQAHTDETTEYDSTGSPIGSVTNASFSLHEEWRNESTESGINTYTPDDLQLTGLAALQKIQEWSDPYREIVEFGGLGGFRLYNNLSLLSAQEYGLQTGQTDVPQPALADIRVWDTQNPFANSSSSFDDANPAVAFLQSPTPKTKTFQKVQYKFVVTPNSPPVINWLEFFTPKGSEQPTGYVFQTWIRADQGESPAYTIDPLAIDPGDANQAHRHPTQDGTWEVEVFTADLAADANRDGVIAANGSDATSAGNSLIFDPNINDDAPGDTFEPDYANNHVDGVSDLKNFVPVFLNIKPLFTALPPGNGVIYKLKQENSAVNIVYTDLIRANAFAYLDIPPPASGFGVDLDQPAAVAQTVWITDQGLNLFAGSTGAAFLDAIQNHNGGIILLEARQFSSKPLVLSVEKNGVIVAEMQLPLLLARVELAVDANRDGTIKLASEDASDAISAVNPYRFWLNDDNDAASGGDANDAVVNGANDLKDFYPVFLNLKQLITVLPTSGGVKYKLKQETGALNFVYTNLTRETAFTYQSGTLTTGFGPSFIQPASSATTQPITEGIELSDDFLNRIKDQNQGVLLIEGRLLTDKPLLLSVEKTDGTVIAEVKLELSTMRVGKLWETANKANQVFNPTAKDDPWGGNGYGGYGTEQNGAPRNMVFLVPDPQDNKYKVTMELGAPATTSGAKLIVAAYVDGIKVANSDRAVTPEGTCDLAFEHPAQEYGPDGVPILNDIVDFTIRVGADANNNNTLDLAEIIKMGVKTYGEPTVRGTRASKYDTARQNIDDIVDGDWTSPNWATDLVLPHAKRFLQIFRDGNPNNPSFPEDKKPTSSSTVTFDAFSGYFAEWLTHNSGAPFDDAGVVDITEYKWNFNTTAADLIASSPQLRNFLRSFYALTVSNLADSHFASLPVGSSAYFPSSTGFFDVDVPNIHESLDWVPKTTVTFASAAPALLNDLNGMIGRGRLLSHKARFLVEKQLVVENGGPDGTVAYEKLVVTQVVSQGTVIDLYDFNHLIGGAGQDAATLQIGYGRGAYGVDRNRGKIYRDRIEFEKIHTSLP